MSLTLIDPRCIELLVEIAKFHGLDVDADSILHQYVVGETPLTQARFIRIALEIGLDVVDQKFSWRKVRGGGQAFPALAISPAGQPFIVSGYEKSQIDASSDKLILARKDETTNRFIHEALDANDSSPLLGGRLLFFKRKDTTKKERRFDLLWFVKELMRQNVLILEVIVVSLIVHLTALALPIYFQITIDKVLVHNSFSTLHVISIAVLIVLIFEGTLKFLRNYLLAFATSKVDMTTATKTFSHLMQLPLPFFQRNTAGVLTKHMQQTEEIREFLTGKVLETALDATALLVFLPLLFFYSFELGLIVLGFSMLIAFVVGVLIRPYFSALTKLYEAEGVRQSLLVEAIHGISTIKSLALEPRRKKVWDESSSKSVRTSFSVDKIGNIAEAVVGTLEQVMTVAILFFGAYFISQGVLTIGALVAFKMISGKVSQPLIKIVEMVHEYQKARLAVQMLGNIMNSPPENSSQSQTLRPALDGNIRFEAVNFFYDGTTTPAIKDVSFAVNAGEIIGIVGRSGSGKSTLARLIQGIHFANTGKIGISRCNVREIDIAHLRQSVGIVLQENFLFRGTVRENLSITAPNASLLEIKRAAELAGATEFIDELPQGYDTLLEENATNLSGGQRQRLAIARALLRDPRLLIFDEATSALDVESETIIQENLKSVAVGRTMIIIAHRLSTLKDADKILVMNQGEVEAFDTHEKLLSSTAGSKTYQLMWDQQLRNAGGIIERGTAS